MKPAIVLAALLVALGRAPSVNADPVLLVNANGILTGAHNVQVGGTLYDVAFVDGTCGEVFGGCETASDFNFTTFADAAAAASALIGQVFVDAPPAGNFDGHPELVLGCTDLFQCSAAIPTTVSTFGGVGVVSGATAYNSPFGKLVSNFNFLTNFDTSTYPIAVWAKFTAAPPVPEPASLVLLGSGLGIAMLRRRKA